MMNNYKEKRSYEIAYDNWIASQLTKANVNQKIYKAMVFAQEQEPEEDNKLNYRIESIKYVINGQVHGKRTSKAYTDYLGKVVSIDPAKIRIGHAQHMDCVRELPPHMKYDSIVTSPVAKVKEDGDYLYIKTWRSYWELRYVG